MLTLLFLLQYTGSVQPIHLQVDSRIVHGFRWVPVSQLLPHEKFIDKRHAALLDHIEAARDQYQTIPAVVACSRSNAIIDGHHRTSVIKALGYEMAPVLYIDYSHPDLLVHQDNDDGAGADDDGEGAGIADGHVNAETGRRVSKQDVVDAAQTGRCLPPKSTAHVIRVGAHGAGGAAPCSYLPVLCLSPMCDLLTGQHGGAE